MEEQEIRIVVDSGKENCTQKFWLSRYKNGKVKEQYAPQTKAFIQVMITAVLNGFDPPCALSILSNLDLSATKEFEVDKPRLLLSIGQEVEIGGTVYRFEKGPNGENHLKFDEETPPSILGVSE